MIYIISTIVHDICSDCWNEAYEDSFEIMGIKIVEQIDSSEDVEEICDCCGKEFINKKGEE